MTSRIDTISVQQADSLHYMHPFTDHADLACRGARVIVRGDDIYLWDSEGKRLLDGMSGLWCVNVGYGRKAIADAVHAQIMQLPFYNSFFETTNLPAVELAQKLVSLAPPQFKRVFYTGSGSEANDTIVRMVRYYWELLGAPERQVIISRQNAYHGSTMAGASLGGMSEMHAQGGLPIPGIVHIAQPNYIESEQDVSAEEFGINAAYCLERKILELGAGKVAAFIAEPVQGAGGVIIPSISYWQEISRICKKYGVLLVTDEVICGFGRLGTWFGCDYFGVEPDLMSFAKGVTSGYVPLGGVLVSSGVADVLALKGGHFNHGFTYSGHPVANLRIIEEEGLVARVRTDSGPYLARQFATLGNHPLVGYQDSCGFMAGLNLVKRKADRMRDCIRFEKEQEVGMLCRRYMFDNGMVMRAVGDRMIIAPPLTMTHAQIDEMIALIGDGLDRTLRELRHRGWV